MPATPSAHRPTGTFARRLTTTVLAVITALAFTFSFGNVWALALRMGVSRPVAPLIAPMVDLSVVGLLVALHHLTTTGTDPAELRPATRLMHLCGLLTLALNTAESLLTEQYGRAGLEAVAPGLLLGWGSVGLPLLRQLHAPRTDPGGARCGGCPESERSRRPETEHSRERLTGDTPRPELTIGGTPSAVAKREEAGQGESSRTEPTARLSEAQVPPAEQDRPEARRPAGRRPAASMDKLAEIARPAVQAQGASIAVVRSALREAAIPISSDRLGQLTQQLKDELAAEQAGAADARSSAA